MLLRFLPALQALLLIHLQQLLLVKCWLPHSTTGPIIQHGSII